MNAKQKVNLLGNEPPSVYAPGANISEAIVNALPAAVRLLVEHLRKKQAA